MIDIIGTGLGDKFTNLYAGKGVVSKIIPDHLMPYCPDTNTIPDVIFNPIGLPRRNNLGVVLESLLGNIIEDIEKSENDETFCKKLEFVNNMIIQKYDEEQYNQIKEDIDRIQNDMVFADVYFTRIQKHGLTLYFDSFDHPKIKELIELAENYCEIFNITPDKIYKKSKFKIKKETIDYLDFDVSFEPEDVEFEALLTNNIYLKLSHNSFSKHNAVGVNLRVNTSTGQSVTGRKSKGSSHISWMTTAGLLGHKQKSGGTLKELLTISADANISDKLQALRQFIINGETHLKKKYKSRTFNYINQNMKFLGIEMETEDDNNDENL
jgi:DNA-directed RNA polymerase beta subunit